MSKTVSSNQGNFLRYLFITTLLLNVFKSLNTIAAFDPYNKSICGLHDDRRPSFNPSVGRVLRPGDKNGCSITLIGKTCAISAGHCHERLDQVEFNVPLSDSIGKIRPSDPSDVYPVDPKSIKFQYEGKGKDWSVFRLGKNSYSNNFPGERFGYHAVAKGSPELGDQLVIFSYGSDKTPGELERNYVQQISSGPVLIIDENFLSYTADTKGGSSGASVISVKTNEVYGIHTHGWCDEEGGWNSATLINGNIELKNAISSCLSWELENL